MLKQCRRRNAISSETKRGDINNEQKWAVAIIDGDGHIKLEWTNKEKMKWVRVFKVTLHRYNARAIYRLERILNLVRLLTVGIQ